MTDPIPLPTGAIVQIQTPRVPVIQMPIPSPTTVLIMPTPGIPGVDGQDGELDPEQLDHVIDEATVEVLADLEPPVSLVLLFENGMA